MRTFPNPTNYPCPYCKASAGEPCVNKIGQAVKGSHYEREPQTTHVSNPDTATIQFLTNMIVRGN